MDKLIDPKIKRIENYYLGKKYIVKIYKIPCNPSVYVILISNQDNHSYNVLICDEDLVTPIESDNQDISRRLFLAFGGTYTDNDLTLRRPQSIDNDDFERLKNVIKEFIKSKYQLEN
ncbi:MAG: hypothetical protein HDR74_03525 [Bacteroides sp.]|nr:hypothetical protein [Bacteroides sp.]